MTSLIVMETNNPQSATKPEESDEESEFDENELIEDLLDEGDIPITATIDPKLKQKIFGEVPLDYSNFLTYEEIDRFLLSIDTMPSLIGCRVMLFAGLRVNELVKLKFGDFNYENGAVLVRNGKGGKDRWVPLDITTLSIVKVWGIQNELSADDSLLNYSKRTMQRWVADAANKSGIPKNITCHTLRHTCATWQIDKGVPIEAVRENLGHAKIAYTQLYLHLQIRQRARMYRDATRFNP